MRKTVIVPTLAATLACSAVFSAPSFSVSPLLGKDFDAYERVLGKPRRIQKEDRTAESTRLLSEVRFYKAVGFVRIVLTKGNDGNKDHPPTVLLDHVSSISIQFPRGSVKRWQTALDKVGLSPAKVVAKSADGYTELTGLPGGWEGAWISNNPDTGTDELQLFHAVP
jgi:hypothetical protein